MGLDNTFIFITFPIDENQEKRYEKTPNPRRVLAGIFGGKHQVSPGTIGLLTQLSLEMAAF